VQVTDQIVGKPGLLQRVAHSAAVHPTEPQTILIYGGFTDYLSSRFLDSLVALDTASMRVKELNPHGIPPSPRAYHQMVMCANRRAPLPAARNPCVRLRSVQLITAHGAGASSLEGARTSPLPLMARTCSQCITPPPTRTSSASESTV
jgi:hypothetical protein